MFVRKFEGETLDEALQSVKRELGPDAIILKTITNKGFKGAFKKNRIEITAAISEQNYEKKARVDHVLSDEQRENFYQTSAQNVNHMINEYDQNRSRPATGSNGYGNMGLNRVVNTVSKASSKIKNSLDDFLALPDEDGGQQSGLDSFLSESNSRTPAVTAHNAIDERDYEEERSHSNGIEEAQSLINANNEYYNEVSSEMQQQLKSQNHQIELLEKKLFELTQNIQSSKQEAVEPKGLKALRTNLRSLELSERIVQTILKKAVFELTDAELEDEDLIFEFALRELNERIAVDMPLFSQASVEGKPVVTVLVSDASCGQSSMAYKLAVLKNDVKVIRFRENELDQNNAEFTRSVFKLDVSTVTTLSHLMSEARKAIQEERSIILDLKLNFKEANESKKFIETLKRSFENIEILLTISAIHSEIYNRKIFSKYKPYSNGVIISYIDQCLSFGPLVNLQDEYDGMPLKFFGTGAVVPDDIEAATAERLLAGLFKL